MANSSTAPAETIVVVDDERGVLSVAEDILQTTMGYPVLSTLDPRVALRFARTHPGEIDLLLTDVVMPLMGGGELAQEFRLIRPEAKVLSCRRTPSGRLRHTASSSRPVSPS